MNVKDPKTTSYGVIALLYALFQLIGIEVTSMELTALFTAAKPVILPILIGLGFLSAKDNDKKKDQ